MITTTGQDILSSNFNIDSGVREGDIHRIGNLRKILKEFALTNGRLSMWPFVGGFAGFSSWWPFIYISQLENRNYNIEILAFI